MINDPVNSPAHYCLSNGAELIDVIEHLPYCRGAAIKYIWRAGRKDPAKRLEDLRKAREYLDREIVYEEREAGALEPELRALDDEAP